MSPNRCFAVFEWGEVWVGSYEFWVWVLSYENWVMKTELFLNQTGSKWLNLYITRFSKTRI